jgi:hypothetical protein
MAYPPITTLPSAPNRNDPENFSTEADAFVAALPALVTETNAAGVYTADQATAAAADAVSTAADVVLTNADVLSTAASAAAAVVTANAAQWVSEASYAAGANAISNIDFGTYRAILTHTGVATDPSADATNWVIISARELASQAVAEAGTDNTESMSPLRTAQAIAALTSGSSLVRSARTSNTIIDGTDKGTLIDITSGTFTQTFTATATLGGGWFCYLQNSGTGDITLDPNASELIDGLSDYIMYSGEVRLIQCDGSALRSIVLMPFHKTFTSSDTFIKPPMYSSFGLYILGGGGGGGAGFASNGRGGIGGSGGGAMELTFLSDSLSATETVTIGAGGANGSGSGGDGGIGGDSKIGAFVIGRGGEGGGGSGASNSQVTGSTGGGFVITNDYATGFEARLRGGGSYAMYGGAGWENYTMVNSNPPYAGTNSLYGGSAGGAGQNENYSASDGGISRVLQPTARGGGGAGAASGPAADMTGTFSAGGGGAGTGGVGGDGGFGCGGGGGGCSNANSTASNGGSGGSGIGYIRGIA